MSTVIRAVRPADEPARAFAYRVLAFYISEMFFLPGEKLVESEIAAQLRLSRTPVHDTFARLTREKLLTTEPRGVFVPLLNTDSIRQLTWMHHTTSVSVLESIYNQHPGMAALEALERLVAVEYDALASGSLARMAGCNQDFYAGLYELAGYAPVYRALHAAGPDLYRLMRLVDDHAVWQYVVDQHTALVQALALHHHEEACEALNRQFALVPPLVQEYRRRMPQYFV